MPPVLDRTRRALGSATSTTQYLQNFPTLSPGPVWRSFEQLRTSGSTAFDTLKGGTVGILHTRNGRYCILRDEDFQRLNGLASEIHRLKRGVTIVLQAAKVVAKHPDEIESVEMLMQSASLLSELDVLPERFGHEAFQLTPTEKAVEMDSGEVNLDDIPRAQTALE